MWGWTKGVLIMSDLNYDVETSAQLLKGTLKQWSYYRVELDLGVMFKRCFTVFMLFSDIL